MRSPSISSALLSRRPMKAVFQVLGANCDERRRFSAKRWPISRVNPARSCSNGCGAARCWPRRAKYYSHCAHGGWRVDRLKAHAKHLAGGLEPELSIAADVMFPMAASAHGLPERSELPMNLRLARHTAESVRVAA
jgi:hypothetical protein